jgi:hypothetical protein
MESIPASDQLYCGFEHKDSCTDCADSRSDFDGKSVPLTCYRRSSSHGVCIAQRDCPQGQACFDDCTDGQGCFGKMCPLQEAPKDCAAFCGVNKDTKKSLGTSTNIICSNPSNDQQLFGPL